jgi:putative ABC transport system permease protein
MGSRRAIGRWGYRLVRREWRQQVLIIGLIAVAIAFACFGTVVLSNAESSQAAAGTTTHVVVLSTKTKTAKEQVGSIANRFDPIAPSMWRVNEQRRGYASEFDLSDARIDFRDPFGVRMFHLTGGVAPKSAGEVALTETLMRRIDANIGTRIDLTGGTYRVVGRIEDPTDLRRLHMVTAPGTLTNATSVHIRIHATDRAVNEIYSSPPTGLEKIEFLSKNDNHRLIGAIISYVVSSVAMIEVGLLCSAGFAMMARRRLRQFGMLSAIGASEKQLRQAMVFNGIVLGGVGGALGVAVGFGGSLMAKPMIEQLAGTRIGFWNMPWISVFPYVALAMVTAGLAAWWPARSVSRRSIASSLASRRPDTPSIRGTSFLSCVLVLVGVAVQVGASQSRSNVISVVGMSVAAIGILLLAPTVVSGFDRMAAKLPLTLRIASRDLARHQSRSASALAALILAIGIPFGVAITSKSSEASSRQKPLNVPENIALIWEKSSAKIPMRLPPEDFDPRSVEQNLEAMSLRIPGSLIVPISLALNPTNKREEVGFADGMHSQRRSHRVSSKPKMLRNGVLTFDFANEPTWIATPELLAAWNVDRSLATSDADVLGEKRNDVFVSIGDNTSPRPLTITSLGLPRHSAVALYWVPETWVTKHGWDRVVKGWTLRAPNAITPDQRTAIAQAAGDKLSVTYSVPVASGSEIRRNALAIGAAIALTILAMILALVRSETFEEQQTLAAVGAPKRTRRAIAAATAWVLALGASLLAIPVGYLGLFSIVSSPGSEQRIVFPTLIVAIVVVGFPLTAGVATWLFSRGTEDFSRRRLL